MAENDSSTTTSGEGGTQPTVEELQKQLADMTAERDKAVEQSRKWEGRSKSNSEKAKKYDELAAQSMTDAERLEAASKKAEEAEAKLAAYEAEAQRAKDVAEISEKTGIPAHLIVGTDRKAMERHAEDIKAFASGQPTAQVFRQDGKKPGKKAPDDMREYVKNLIH